MNSYINNKFYNNIMNKSFSMLTIIFIMLMFTTTAYSNIIETDYTAGRYEFEEGGGSVIIDSSGNSFHGIGSSVSWDSAPYVRWGSHALWFDGSNDYVLIDTIPAGTLQANNSFSVWIYPYSSPVNSKQVVFLIDDKVTANLETGLSIDSTDFSLVWDYTDTTLTQRSQPLPNSTLSTNVYNHIAVNINLVESKVCLFVNGVFEGTTTLDHQIYTIPGTEKQIYIGSSPITSTNELDATLDELRFFTTLLNQTHVTDLHENNDITFYVQTGEVTPDETLQSSIIISQSPEDNSTQQNPVSFGALLNVKSDCELYIDNALDESFNDSVAFTTKKILELGNHDYFMYCEYIKNDTMYYDFSDFNSFEVIENDPLSVSFYVDGIDFDVDDLDLWITTPCLEGTIGKGVILPYQSDKNPNGAFFERVNDRQATFNVVPGVHDFCLYNARFVVSGENQTNNYDITSYSGMVELGRLDVPNNTTTSFFIDLESFDVYEKTDPKAWGQTWAGVIMGMFLGFLGLLCLIAGISTSNGKLAFVGAILLLAAAGIEFTTLVGAII